MRGDFSAWNKDRSQNFRGTLHQQGRVLIDRDWNAQSEITAEWQETAGRDAFGAGVAAIPAEVPASFKVTKAEKILVPSIHVEVSVKQGRVWADGLLVESAQDLVRTATYINPPPGTIADIPAAGVRDAVILETWLEELSPFQVPDQLLEPALGGVDTTERVQAAYRFRLFRLGKDIDGNDETCSSIIPKLKDDFSTKGKLLAKLNPTVKTDGDCPVVESGGYTGFEHRLYRIEIAETEKAGSWFKWSQFNGGLVGRGFFDAANNKVVIKANENAIVHSGINSFYLEALAFDPALGTWRVIYGVQNVTLAADHTLTLSAVATDKFIGAIPPSPPGDEKIYFFRLWNGIESIGGFTAAGGTDLPDKVGIKLAFEADGAGKYTSGDFWTFPVRVGKNELTLVNNLPPQGIFYHRVPLAELNWDANPVAGDKIEDCRLIFQPLTKLKTCCTYRVGDGVSSHGDFTKIQEAIDALPKTGGEVCILPGTYLENITVKDRSGVILKGCGRRTIIKAEKTNSDPVISVEHSQRITIESLAVVAHPDGIGISLIGEERAAADGEVEKKKYLEDIDLSRLFVVAARKSAIKGYVAQFLTLSNSVVYIEDEETREPAVYLEGDDMLIERSEIRVLAGRTKSIKAPAGTLSGDPESFEDLVFNDPAFFSVTAEGAEGGLQIGGGSERVRIINNLIINGRGNGISLGRIDLEKDGETVPGRDPFDPKDKDDDCCNPDDGTIDDGEENEDGYTAVAGPPLYDILIKFNRIYNMGRNGIGVVSFFSMGEEMDMETLGNVKEIGVKGVILVSKLLICENRIERCMNISPPPLTEKMAHLMGYGGIALAVVEKLVIRDNFLIDNCRDARDPVCGIYTLAAIGLEISRNEITENIPQNFEDINAANVVIGPRGGIWVFIAIGQMDTGQTSAFRKYEKIDIFRQASGLHAAKIHENVVSVPLGRSLTVMILGDASVVGNRFTSFGIQPVNLFALAVSIIYGPGFTMTAFLQILGLLAGNVLIIDLGTYRLINQHRALGRHVKVGNTGKDEAAKVTSATDTPAPAPIDGNPTTPPDTELEERKRLAAMLAKGGLILFANNQCKLNPQGEGLSFALSSILIAGLADVGFHDNQVSCDLPDDVLLMNAALAGGTLRVTGNLFKETLDSVAASAMTFGVLNATTDNESTHCLYILGALYLNRHNLVLSAYVYANVHGDIFTDAGYEQEKYCMSGKGFANMAERLSKGLKRSENESNTMQPAEVTMEIK